MTERATSNKSTPAKPRAKKTTAAGETSTRTRTARAPRAKTPAPRASAAGELQPAAAGESQPAVAGEPRAAESRIAAAPAAGEGREVTSAGAPALPPVSREERWRMIADRAYYRARERDFIGGDPVEDWLAAEEEIDSLLKAEGRAPPA